MGLKINIKLFCIVLLGLVLRLIFCWPIFNDEYKAVQHDTSSYTNIANNLLNGNGYSNCAEAPYYKDVKRPPVYPVFLMGLYKITSVCFINVVLAQILLDLASLLLIFFIAKHIFENQQIAYLSSTLYALSSHAITYCGSAITETLFVFILMLLLYLIFCVKMKLIGKVFIFSLLWSSLVLCRPIALYTLIIFVPLWFSILEMKWKQKLLLGLTTIILSLVLPFSWMMRNQKLTKVKTLSSIMDVNLLALNANAINAKHLNQNEDELRLKLKKEKEHVVFNDCNGDYEYVQSYRSEGIKNIKSALPEYILIHFSYFPNLFLPEISKLMDDRTKTKQRSGTLAVINQKGLWQGVKYYISGRENTIWFALPLTLFWLCTLIFSIYGFSLYLSRNFGPVALLIGFLMIYFLILPGPGSVPRFMFPNVPLLCMFAAIGIYTFRYSFNKRAKG